MALVKIEPYVIDDVANYTFGGLTITSNAAFGNANLGNLATANFVTVTSNLVSGNANLGNAASANYFIGNGSLLTDITTTSLVNGTSNVVVSNNSNVSVGVGGTGNVVIIASTGINVSGYVSATSFSGEAGNLSNIQGSNVSGTVGSATTAGTVTTAAQPNITSLGLLANLSVNGNSSFIGTANIVGNINQSGGTANLSNLSVTNNTALTGASVNLGNVANLHISGGSANYVLQTDGAGNLSWASAGSASTTPGDVVVDNFTGDGANSSFTLSITPDAVKYVIVNIDGVFQLRQSYSLDGNVLTFGSAPLSSSLIEVSTTVPGTILSGGSNVDFGNVSSNIVPTSNITYDLGSAAKRWKDLYLSNSTIHLGDTAFSADANGNIILGNITLDSNLGNVTTSHFLPFNLTIAAETLTIQVDAPAAGDNIVWLWTWQQSTLPYARATITNSQQPSVPLYKKGTYTLNNFAHTLHGNMTQTHDGYFKWIDGAGDDNLISWAGNSTTATVTHPDINGGNATTVQRYTFTVPENITIPTLNAPNITYDVSVANGQYYFGPMAGEGYNVNLGPVYRGGTYTFNLDSSLSGHKFYLTTDNGTGFVSEGYVGEYTNGVTGSRNDGSTGKTTLTFVVPSNAPDVLFYQSATDASMHGAITIKDLAVETNINGNYVVYFQHEHEGHKTPIELRPIPSMVNQMCLVYDQTVGRFVPQDMATYVENTPSFKNKIREVAGTATLIAPNGVAVVPTVLVVEDISYLPLVDNKDGDIAFDSYTNTMYVWGTNAWKSTKPTSVATVTTNAQPNITSVGTLTGLTVSGNILPTANLTYNLGSPTARFKDIYLSGTTIDLAGATIKTDANTGAIALIPQPTLAVPNPIGIVITASGTLATVTTTAGEANVSQIANAVSNSANFASTNYVDSAVANLVNSSPSALDTLNELATALGNDASFSTTVTNSLANKLNSNAFTYANISGKPTLGNITTINLDGNASTILYGNGVFAAAPVSYANSNVASYLPTYTGNLTPGNLIVGTSNLKLSGGTANYVLKTDGTGNVSWANVATLSTAGASATVASSAPATTTAGSLWYDNTTTGELYVFDGNSWVSTSIVPMTNASDPTLSGVNQANENANITITITNYSNTYSYQITTTAGTTTRSNASIYWQLPSVDANASHSITVQAVSGSGVASSIVTKSVTVLNTSVTDTAIIVSDFSYSDLNTGWAI